MTAQEMQKIHESTFERIRKANQYGQDYWFARALQTVLGYSKWDKFLLVIEKARQACANSGQEITNHFLQTGKMVDIGSGAQRD